MHCTTSSNTPCIVLYQQRVVTVSYPAVYMLLYNIQQITRHGKLAQKTAKNRPFKVSCNANSLYSFRQCTMLSLCVIKFSRARSNEQGVLFAYICLIVHYCMQTLCIIQQSTRQYPAVFYRHCTVSTNTLDITEYLAALQTLNRIQQCSRYCTVWCRSALDTVQQQFSRLCTVSSGVLHIDIAKYLPMYQTLQSNQICSIRYTVSSSALDIAQYPACGALEIVQYLDSELDIVLYAAVLYVLHSTHQCSRKSAVSSSSALDIVLVFSCALVIAQYPAVLQTQ